MLSCRLGETVHQEGPGTIAPKTTSALNRTGLSKTGSGREPFRKPSNPIGFEGGCCLPTGLRGQHPETNIGSVQSRWVAFRLRPPPQGLTTKPTGFGRARCLPIGSRDGLPKKQHLF